MVNLAAGFLGASVIYWALDQNLKRRQDFYRDIQQITTHLNRVNVLSAQTADLTKDLSRITGRINQLTGYAEDKKPSTQVLYFRISISLQSESLKIRREVLSGYREILTLSLEIQRLLNELGRPQEAKAVQKSIEMVVKSISQLEEHENMAANSVYNQIAILDDMEEKLSKSSQ